MLQNYSTHCGKRGENQIMIRRNIRSMIVLHTFTKGECSYYVHTYFQIDLHFQGPTFSHAETKLK